MKGKLYKDKLSIDQAEEGISMAISNAHELLADAELLFTNARYQRSLSLSVLAIEEAGKSSIIRSIIVCDDQRALYEEWKNYRNHTSKNIQWILPELFLKGAKKLKDIEQITDPKSGHGKVLEELKQLSLYTDLFTNGKWNNPKEFVTKDLAETVLNIARIVVPSNNSAMTTSPELKLWIKHMKPIWKSDMASMKKALINCYNEAEKSGVLKGEIKTEHLVDFLL